MESACAVITVNILQRNESHDLEVPLDISASELGEALYATYFPGIQRAAEQCALKAERPIALLQGEMTLRESGIRNGSVINITG